MHNKSKTIKLMYGLLMFICLLWLIPLIFAVFTSLKSNQEALVSGYKLIPDQFTLSSWRNIVTDPQAPVLRWVLNSLFVATVHVTLALVISSVTAYGYCFIDFKGKRIMLSLLVGSLMIPTVASIIPLYKIIDSMGAVDTYFSLIVPQLGAAFATILVYNYLKDIPYELVEAAQIDGAKHSWIYFNIMLPLMKPILTVTGLFCFLGNWNDFFWPTIIMNDKNKMTITAGLRIIQGDYGLEPANVMAAAVLSAIPVFIIFIFAQKHLMSGISMNSGIK